MTKANDVFLSENVSHPSPLFSITFCISTSFILRSAPLVIYVLLLAEFMESPVLCHSLQSFTKEKITKIVALLQCREEVNKQMHQNLFPRVAHPPVNENPSLNWNLARRP